MFIHRCAKFGRILPVILVFFTGFTLSCSKEQFKEMGPKSNRQDILEIVGYGYVRLSPNARSNQITLARQRARMQAANNLAAHISGVEFNYDKRKKQTVTLDKFQAHTRGTINGATTEYYPAGKSAILVKQTLRIKRARPKLPRTTILKTSFRTEDMAKSLIRVYREAVTYTILRKFPSRNSATGKIFLAHMQISDHKEPGPLKVTLELRITLK
jgi:hypothetical protein